MVFRPLWRLAAGSALLCVLALAGQSVERTLEVIALPAAMGSKTVPVMLSASTDAGQGERIGLFQADYSIDGGRTWTGLCYMDNLGPATRQERSITPGPAGTTIKVRLRVAFREGLAGDVDYTGAAIRWNAGWGKWDEPPAKSIAIPVK